MAKKKGAQKNKRKKQQLQKAGPRKPLNTSVHALGSLTVAMMVKNEEYFKKPMILLRQYRPAIEYFGEPIKSKRLDLRAKGLNEVGEFTAKVRECLSVGNNITTHGVGMV